MKKLMFLFSIVLITVSINSYGQREALPRMFVEKNTGIKRILQFSQVSNSKFRILEKTNGYQDLFLIYSKKAVNDLLTMFREKQVPEVRIYFAKYTPCDGTVLPTAIEEDKVILLFAADTKDQLPAEYYFLNEKGSDDKIYTVSKECGENWRWNYENNVLPELLPTINQNDSDNIDPKNNDQISDTKSILYSFNSLEEAITKEEGYTHKLNGKKIYISAYQFSFSAYDAKGNGYEGSDDVYKKRMLVQIDYMYDPGTGNEVFYLDDLDSFSLRSKPAQKSQKAASKKMKTIAKKHPSKENIFALNNGQLCPTHCPPPPPPPQKQKGK